ncbi:hypothetical protein BDW22DRAFT_1425763 [Trametopsis cervina]|nr:hypothetical protein BDW22DRAFT_1425763 [Trametopsis cervina]
MIPKFANPHLLVQASQTVSRADLDAEHDTPILDEEEHSTNDDVLRLERLLKRSLGDLHIEQDPPSPDSHKSKKRKSKKNDEDVEEQAIEVEETVSFRLFSNTAPKLVSLKPKPVSVMKVAERSYVDDDAEASQRAERARVAAVDFDWILEQSLQPSYPSTRNAKKTMHLVMDTPVDYLPMLVVDIPTHKSSSSTLLPPPPRLPKKEHPSPHDFPADKISCPVLSAHEPSDHKTKRRRFRRRGKTAEGGVKKRPPPAFFRPLTEWGGKSAGYAMGYEGSSPALTEGARQRKYRRDSMRTGVMTKW